jgi:hypothetical protein
MMGLQGHHIDFDEPVRPVAAAAPLAVAAR